MFSTKFAAVFAVLAAAASAVSAAPAGTFDPSSIHEDIVFSPSVISPAAGDVWPVASTQTITWDTSKIPAEAANSTGLILLGYINDGSDNEHLDLDDSLHLTADEARQLAAHLIAVADEITVVV